MKRISIIFSIILYVGIAMTARGINFSMTLLDDNGNPAVSTTTNLRLSVKQGETDGADLYVETQTVTSNAYGVIHTVLGEGTPQGALWNDVNWALYPLYLQVERSDDNADYELISIMPLGAVPYSYYSEKTGKLQLKSPDGTNWSVGVSDNGTFTATKCAPDDAPAYGTVDYIFDIEALPTITLEVSVDEWNTLLHNFDLNKDNEECVHCNFTFSKYGRVDRLDDIGLRLRGNTSRVRPEGAAGEDHVPGNVVRRPHLGFRFQKYHKDDPAWTLSGTDRFNLRWANGDPTYVREVYGYDLMRRFGVYTAARASYCMVYLKIGDENPIYLGVSEMFECYEDQYLNEHAAKGDFAGTSGYLWKGGWSELDGKWYGADFAHAFRGLMGICETTVSPAATINYAYDYKSKKKKLEEAKDQLETFINNINTLTGDEFKTWAESAIDIDLLLRQMACEAAIGHWDDLWYNGNNFYAYFDNDGDKRLRLIPYDMDNTLGNDQIDCATKDPINWGHSPLVNKVLSVQTWREKYIDYLFELADPAKDYIDPVKSAARITKWQNLIRDHVKNDTWYGNNLSDQPGWSDTKKYHLTGTTDNYFTTRVQTIKALRQ